MQTKNAPIAWIRTSKASLMMTVLATMSQLVACGGGSSGGASSSGGGSVSKEPKVTQFSPQEAYQNFSVSFGAQGVNLPTLSLSQVSIANCANLRLSSQSKTAIVFNCTPTVLGAQPVKLVDAKGATLYSGTVNVLAYPDAQVDRVEPLTAIVEQNQVFKFFGQNLDKNGFVVVDENFCTTPKILARSKESLTFSCTPRTLNSFSLSIKNRLRQQVFSASISVRKPTPVVTSVQPKLLALNQMSLFLVDGNFLSSGIQVEVENCTNIQRSSAPAQPSAQIVACTPTQLGAAKLNIIDPASKKVIWTDSLTVIDRPVQFKPLTRTGFTQCSTSENGLSQPAACTAAALGAAAGFGQDGELKLGEPVRYEVLSNGCIKDQNTGLIWEKKTNNGGLNDQKWTYTWYNTNSLLNGDFVGYIKPAKSVGVTCHSSLANCNTEAYIQKLNESKYCGYQNWRMPNLSELNALQVFDTPADNHPNRVFYAAGASNNSGYVWSASPGVFYPIYDSKQVRAWAVDLFGNFNEMQRKNGVTGVLAVRDDDTLANRLKHYSYPNTGGSLCNFNGESLHPNYDYKVVAGSNGAEVLDQKTNLIWQRCTIGQTWDGSDCVGQPKAMNWLEGLKAAKALGSGYRVPNLRELLSLREANCSEPSINAEIFPNTVVTDGSYMSSSPRRDVSFLYGWQGIENKRYVRAVRSAP